MSTTAADANGQGTSGFLSRAVITSTLCDTTVRGA